MPPSELLYENCLPDPLVDFEVPVNDGLLVLPPSAIVMLTVPESWKPGSVGSLQAASLQPLYATGLVAKYASSEVAALRRSELARASKPRCRYEANCGMAMAARMPMMATTTSSSINVKPLLFFNAFMLPPD